MVTKRVQGKTPLLLKGCRREGHSYMGKSAMVTESVQGHHGNTANILKIKNDRSLGLGSTFI